MLCRLEQPRARAGMLTDWKVLGTDRPTAFVVPQTCNDRHKQEQDLRRGRGYAG
jgi:hypothetical protein